MRVTDSMTFAAANAAIMRSRERVQDAVGEVSSGLRIEHPSDDPTGSALAVVHGQREARLTAMAEAAARASDELVVVDGALEGIGELLFRAKELAVQLSNDTYSAGQRTAAAEEIDGLRNHVISLLNSQHGTRYVFAGFLETTPPFDATGAYLGDTGVREVEIGEGVRQSYSIRADVALAGAGPGGGMNTLQLLDDFATALRANDLATVRQTVADLDVGIEQLAFARAEAGSAMNVLDASVAVHQAAKVHTQAAHSRISDADIADAATRLAGAQQALQAALTAGAQGFRFTLLDFMR